MKFRNEMHTYICYVHLKYFSENNVWNLGKAPSDVQNARRQIHDGISCWLMSEYFDNQIPQAAWVSLTHSLSLSLGKSNTTNTFTFSDQSIHQNQQELCKCSTTDCELLQTYHIFCGRILQILIFVITQQRKNTYSLLSLNLYVWIFGFGYTHKIHR